MRSNDNDLKRLSSVSTSEISDALDASGIEGALNGIKSINPGRKLIGPAYTLKYAPYHASTNKTFVGAANYIDHIQSNSVIVIDNEGREDCTVWGDILTETALHKKISGTVVNGAVRDVAGIRQTPYPVFAKHIFMRSGKNRVYKCQEQEPLSIQNITIFPGDIIFADDNGVLVIPQGILHEVIEKAVNIKKTEQNIISAVKAGYTLEQARKDYGYDKPWLRKKRDKKTDPNRG